MGIDPSGDIPRKAYDKARLKIRSKREVLSAGAAKARASVARTIKLRQVPEERVREILEICRKNECGSYGIVGGEDTCHRCNCHGSGLVDKISSKQAVCPLPVPLWSNADEY